MVGEIFRTRTEPQHNTASTVVGLDTKKTVQTPPTTPTHKLNGTIQEDQMTTTRYNVISNNK